MTRYDKFVASDFHGKVWQFRVAREDITVLGIVVMRARDLAVIVRDDAVIHKEERRARVTNDFDSGGLEATLPNGITRALE